MTARFWVPANATRADIEASPLGSVITYAIRQDEPVTYGLGYPAHRGGWWMPVDWNPAHVAVADGSEVLR